MTVASASGSIYDCSGYRLPTEAEWEYAARAGTDLLYAGSDTASDVAWQAGNSGSATHHLHPPGQRSSDLGFRLMRTIP